MKGRYALGLLLIGLGFYVLTRVWITGHISFFMPASLTDTQIQDNSSQSTGLLKGIVYHPDPSCDAPDKLCGAPQSNYRMIVTSQDRQFAVVVLSDVNGNYSLSLSPGNYVLTSVNGPYQFQVIGGKATIVNIRV